MLTWSDAYATGIAQIDKDHRHLLAILNNLEERLASGETGELANDLEFFAVYAEGHFQREENHPVIRSCSHSGANCSAHECFRRKVGSWRARFDVTGATVNLMHVIHAELSDWIIDHIMKIDRVAVASARAP